MNQFLLALLLAIPPTLINTWVLRRRGIKQFSYTFLGFIGFFGIAVTVLKLLN